MARHALVLDASVGVKWFSTVNEAYVPQARAILTANAAGSVTITVPDLFFHEVCNALVHKSAFTPCRLEEAITELFEVGLLVFPTGKDLLRTAAQIARKSRITEYDACYAAVATETGCPLVTANPRHQAQALGCEVIPIAEWR